MARLVDNPDIRREMNNVRRKLASKNPHGYTCPIEIEVNGCQTFVDDILPLYFASSVVRDALKELPSRPCRAVFKVEGYTKREAVQIVLDYANGNARSKNWAADLDEKPHLAAYVWELALQYKVDNLEYYSRDLAFDAEYGSLNLETAPRLFSKSERYPAQRQKAKLYICYHLKSYRPNLPQQGLVDMARNFPLLSVDDMKEILSSKHLRAKPDQVFSVLTRWYNDDPERHDDWYYLVEKFVILPLAHSQEVEERREFFQDRVTERILPRKPESNNHRLRNKNSHFVAFNLEDLRTEVAFDPDPYYPIRLKGVFEAYNYYWQMQAVWYGPRAGGPSVGVYLRLLHGSDRAGRYVDGRNEPNQEVAGVIVKFRLRIHASDNFKKCQVQSVLYDEDMFTPRAGREMIGDRRLLHRDTARAFRKGKYTSYASVEMCSVKEVGPSYF